MAYRPRYAIVYDGCSFHVTWRCHNKEWFLKENWAKQLYYDLMLKYKDRYRIQIHAYQLMENHPHLIGTMESKERFSSFFRVINNLFAREVNKRLKRKGQVVMDRFKSPRIQDDRHMIRAMTYVDLNGVRAKRDRLPEESSWSSYAYYAYGQADTLITPAPSYIALGRTDKERQTAYRAMVEELIFREQINISDTCYIGDPSWVKVQYDKLNEEMKAKRKERQKNSSAKDPP